SWTRASRWDADPDSDSYVHADQHAIVLPGGDLIYTANDGGVARSADFGRKWKMRAHKLVNTMFFNIDVCRHNPEIFGGGAQDNGCLLAVDGSYLRVLGGDGTSIVFDPHREGHAFASRSDIHIARHTAAKHWSEEFWHAASPHGMTDAEHRQNALAIISPDP